jgi:hypothetical protein
VAIRERIDQLRAKWQATHKGTPDAKLVAKWKEQAWRETRPAKDATHRTLAELCHRWAKEIKQFGYRPKTILKAALGHPPNVVDAGTVLADKQLAAQLAEVLLAHSAANLKPRDRKTEAARLAANPDQVLEMAAGPTLAGVANWRTTWSELQLRASAERLTRMVRFNSPQARQQLVDEITARAASRCRRVRWDRYVLPDDASGDLRVALRGRAGFDQQHQPTYTTHLIWDAETNLMRLFTTTGDNTVPYLTVEAATQAVEESVRAYQAAHGFALASDQRRAVEQVLASQTRLTAIVGPAGTGKTTSMKVLRDTWEHVYGGGRVVALAPSAAAAQVLGTQLDVAATTVAKWLWETDPLQQAKRRQRIDQLWQAPGTDQVMTSLTKLLLEDRFYQTKPFDLVIVDEAAMTGTISLARLADQVEQAGAKMLLVGDPSQLDAVEAGGILGWADREGHATELTSLWRFEEPWMASASLALRRGRHIGIDQYAAHGMIHEGSSDDMREAAYAKALNDFKTGVPAVLIAASNEEVTDLSERASLDLRAAGLVDSTASIPVRAGLDAGLGERIVARKNDRRVQDQYGNPINNGTFMRIIEAPRQGPVIAVREDNHATIELDPTWIQQNCELGYAVTVHRAQGITVDHSYFLLGAHARTTRELFYVAMTRGRKTNQVFTALMSEEEAHHLGVRSDDIPTAEQRLTQVLRTEGAEKTAHETADQLTHEGMALQRLIPEHDYLASLVYAERCKQDLKRANPTLADGIDQYPAWPSLVATWTKARMIAPTDAWMRVSKPVIEDNNIGDVAAILHSRLTSITDDAVIDPTDQRWIGGLVPAIRTTDPVIGALAQQNETMIEQRIRQLAAVTHPWETDMAPRPDNNTPAVSMWDAARLQAAIYRDQWGVDSIDALGPAPVGSERQHRQWQRAKDNLAAHDWVPQPADDLIEAWDELGAAPPTDPPPEEPPPEPELEPGLLPPAVWSDPTSGAGL